MGQYPNTSPAPPSFVSHGLGMTPIAASSASTILRRDLSLLSLQNEHWLLAQWLGRFERSESIYFFPCRDCVEMEPFSVTHEPRLAPSCPFLQ